MPPICNLSALTSSKKQTLHMNTTTHEHMPRWARKCDEFGKRHCDEKSYGKRKGEYVGNIIFNLIFLWIVNKIPDWNPGFIGGNYGAVLWILNVNILIQIGGNALMWIFDFRMLRYLSRIIMEASSFLTVMTLYFIYPFDFSHYLNLSWIDRILPILFIIAMVVSAFKVAGNIWKLIFWRP